MGGGKGGGRGKGGILIGGGKGGRGRGGGGIDWIYLAQARDSWRALVK